MLVRYIDAHCHVQFSNYDEDRDEVIARMREEGVGGIVVGCDLESSKQAVTLAEKHDHLWAAVGLHPHHDEGEVFDVEAYRALAQNAKVVAIGECGLDYFRTDDIAATRDAQMPLFKTHVQLAAELHKPLIIHARPSKGTMDAYEDVIATLREMKKDHPDLRGDVHFFVGGVSEMKAFTELGFTVSFTAVITFARDYDEVVRTVPSEYILGETDAPFVAPVSRRGQRNDPLAVVNVVAKIAEIRGENPEKMRGILLENTKSLFGI